MNNNSRYINTDENNFENQKLVLDNQKKEIPETYNIPFEKRYTMVPGLMGIRKQPDYNNIEKQNEKRKDKYDLLAEYLYNRNDTEFNSLTRYISNYINIDSRFRNKQSQFTNINYIGLVNNPLLIQDSNKKNIISIKIDSIKIGEYKINDLISLIGIQDIKKTLLVNFGFFTFTVGSFYLKVNYPHNLYFNNLNEAKAYDTSNIKVKFNGIRSNDINSSFIGNIPVTTLNTSLQVFPYNPENDDWSNDYFFIKLVKKYTEIVPIPPSNFINYTIDMSYLYTIGIPNNKINSKYPINNNQLQAYHSVNRVTNNTIEIIINGINPSYIIDPLKPIEFGGDKIGIAKIENITQSYLTPVQYKINLDKIYNNVVLLKLISTEFPILNKLVSNSIDLDSNNCNLYWQNLDDGDYIYNIKLDYGNYLLTDLIKKMEKKINSIKRINLDAFNIIKIDNVANSNEFVFNSSKIINLVNPITNIIYNTTFSAVITINYPNHQLNINDNITIYDSLDVDKIANIDINKTHKVFSIVDDNNFQLLLNYINFTGNMVSNGGGNSFKIESSNIFRLRFDFKDTIGNIFGFRNLGDSNSITVFSDSISNRDLYLNESINNDLLYFDQNNKPKIKSLDLKNDNYILMKCDTNNLSENTFNQMSSFSKIRNIFAKIQIYNLENSVNNYVYNSFIQSPIYIHNPINELRELTFSFYDKYGNLLNYSDFEHSFILEIVTVAEIPENTNLSAKYNKTN